MRQRGRQRQRRGADDLVHLSQMRRQACQRRRRIPICWPGQGALPLAGLGQAFARDDDAEGRAFGHLRHGVEQCFFPAVQLNQAAAIAQARDQPGVVLAACAGALRFCHAADKMEFNRRPMLQQQAARFAGGRIPDERAAHSRKTPAARNKARVSNKGRPITPECDPISVRTKASATPCTA